MKSKNYKSYQIRCDCGAEILEFSYWDDDLDYYYITLYKASAGMGFWWRLKNAWKYLVYGEFHGNAIVVSKDDLTAIHYWLGELVPKTVPYTVSTSVERDWNTPEEDKAWSKL